MKTIPLFLLVIVLMCSCSQKTSQTLSQSEKDRISQEINLTMDSMLLACNKLDANSAFKFIFNSPEYKSVESDGSVLNWESDFKGAADFFKLCTSSNLQSIQKDNFILSSDLVINTMSFNGESILKTEKISLGKTTATSVVKKINNNWRIIYWHSSSLPPSVTPIDPK